GTLGSDGHAPHLLLLAQPAPRSAGVGVRGCDGLKTTHVTPHVLAPWESQHILPRHPAHSAHSAHSPFSPAPRCWLRACLYLLCNQLGPVLPTPRSICCQERQMTALLGRKPPSLR